MRIELRGIVGMEPLIAGRTHRNIGGDSLCTAILDLLPLEKIIGRGRDGDQGFGIAYPAQQGIPVMDVDETGDNIPFEIRDEYLQVLRKHP